MNLPDCEECYDAPATRLWDLGSQHEFWTGVRHLNVCDECLKKLDNYTGPDEPDYDAPTAREVQLKTYHDKYYK